MRVIPEIIERSSGFGFTRPQAPQLIGLLVRHRPTVRPTSGCSNQIRETDQDVGEQPEYDCDFEEADGEGDRNGEASLTGAA